MAIVEDWQKIGSLIRGFMASRVIISAQKVGLFEALKRPSTSKTVAKKLSLNLRATEMVLDALTGLGLLQKQKNQYSIRPLAKRFFLSESPHYMGHMIEHMDNLWSSWSQLTDILKNGGPARREDFDHNTFILAMEDIAKWKAKEVLKYLNLKGMKRALDLGGGPGTYSRALARKGIKVTLFDRPETLSIARELAEKDGLAERIELKGGDFMKDPIGRGYDLVIMSQILHSYGPRDCLRLLKKVKNSLNPGGLVAIHEFFVKKDRSGPSSGTLFGVNMLVNTPEGRVYPLEEIREMLKKTNFKRLSSYHLQDTILIIAKA